MDLSPGETITLTYGDAHTWPSRTTFDGVSAGDVLYAQIDSGKVGSDYGAVLENHEITAGMYNNISKYVVTSNPATSHDRDGWPKRP